MLVPWLARYLIPWLLISYVTCTPVSERKSSHTVRQSAVGVVTGVKSRDENGNVYVRREVRDLKNNAPDQWSLYILALRQLHTTPQSNPNSFYGIASIHGRPYDIWGDAPGRKEKIGKAGYCPHGNELFLGWHRPYLALFEQALSSHVYDIAKKAPADQIERYLKAANEFRIPYWDWAQGNTIGPVPDFFTAPEIAVTDTDGSLTVVSNPLYSYKFNPIPAGFDHKWASMSSTIRWPSDATANATSRQSMFVGAFNGQSTNLISQIVSNVDRLLALYQGAHPDLWMEKSSIGPHGNVYLDDYQDVDANTELLPFRKDPGKFMTFNDCRNTTVLGYAYPETKRWKFASDQAYQADVAAQIARMYGGRARAQSKVTVMSTKPTPFGETLEDSNGTYTDWIIETQAVASKLPPSFIVKYSLGGMFNSDPVVDVGSWMMLMPERLDDVHTEKDPSKPEKLMNGTTSITPYLVEQIENKSLKSLEPSDVVPFLTEKLTWNVYDQNGERVKFPDQKTLSVKVFSTSARVPDNDQEPIEYDEGSTTYPEITAGKSGGNKMGPPGMMPPRF
ncbi:hypothetical protein J4E90_004292 [Alternaria incomplexa]|uniref:uncharacterized protein n=1 Tax=Alternaria incomplexa TaxID=1187928 RepID=UPI00221EF5ED|nr:uncharacterized protein J4E90_004292 [Alternaria incomplexa]KAI4915846.1 hypothetical protein J4E90_004292 [Alternaria incomplexa]